jgi:hypothetical protein
MGVLQNFILQHARWKNGFQGEDYALNFAPIRRETTVFLVSTSRRIGLYDFFTSWGIGLRDFFTDRRSGSVRSFYRPEGRFLTVSSILQHTLEGTSQRLMSLPVRSLMDSFEAAKRLRKGPI